MRAIFWLFACVSVGVGAFWIWTNFPEARSIVQDLVPTGKFQTLEMRYTAEAIMDHHRRELLKDDQHTYLEPTLTYYPYLLLEVKYNRNQEKTGEGIILWSLVDGEMVINTHNWETTHGFMDCINANAASKEFKVINALALRNGILDREKLSKALNVDDRTLDTWIDSCRKKNLIVQSGNNYRLHLQDPKLQVKPETELNHWLVTKTSREANRISRRFRASQIETTAKAAFGDDFAIRKTTEIFLPVYSIIIQNPDGSQMTTYWNALNGKRIDQPIHFE